MADALYTIGFNLETKGFAAGLRQLQREFERFTTGIGRGSYTNPRTGQSLGLSGSRQVASGIRTFEGDARAFAAQLKLAPAELTKFNRVINTLVQSADRAAKTYDQLVQNRSRNGMTDREAERSAGVFVANRARALARAGGVETSTSVLGVGQRDERLQQSRASAYRSALDDRLTAARLSVIEQRRSLLALRAHSAEEQELARLVGRARSLEQEIVLQRQRIARRAAGQGTSTGAFEAEQAGRFDASRASLIEQRRILRFLRLSAGQEERLARITQQVAATQQEILVLRGRAAARAAGVGTSGEANEAELAGRLQAERASEIEQRRILRFLRQRGAQEQQIAAISQRTRATEEEILLLRRRAAARAAGRGTSGGAFAADQGGRFNEARASEVEQRRILRFLRQHAAEEQQLAAIAARTRATEEEILRLRRRAAARAEGRGTLRGAQAAGVAEQQTAARLAVIEQNRILSGLRRNRSAEERLGTLKARAVAVEGQILQERRKLAIEAFKSSELAKQGTLYQRFLARREVKRTGELASPLQQQTARQAVGSAFITTGRYAISGAATYGLLNIIQNTVRETQQLERELAALSGAFDQAGESGEGAFKGAREQILQLSRETGAQADQMALAYRQLLPVVAGEGASGVVDTEAARRTGRLSKKAFQFAEVTGLDVREITDSLTSIRVAFRETFEADFGAGAAGIDKGFESFLDTAINLEDQMGVLARETVTFTADLAPMAAASGFTATQLAGLGAVMQQISGRSGAALAEAFGRILAVFTDSREEILSLTGSLPGFNVQKIAQGFATNEIDEVLAQVILGINTLKKDAPEAARGVQDVFTKMLGGRREGATFNALIENGTQSLAAIREALGAASGEGQDALSKRYAKVQDSIQSSFERMKQSFESLVHNIIASGLGDAIAYIIQAFGGMLNVMNDVIEFMAKFGGVMDGIPARILFIGAALLGVTKAFRALQALAKTGLIIDIAQAALGSGLVPGGGLLSRGIGGIRNRRAGVPTPPVGGGKLGSLGLLFGSYGMQQAGSPDIGRSKYDIKGTQEAQKGLKGVGDSVKKLGGDIRAGGISGAASAAGSAVRSLARALGPLALAIAAVELVSEIQTQRANAKKRASDLSNIAAVADAGKLYSAMSDSANGPSKDLLTRAISNRFVQAIPGVGAVAGIADWATGGKSGKDPRETLRKEFNRRFGYGSRGVQIKEALDTGAIDQKRSNEIRKKLADKDYDYVDNALNDIADRDPAVAKAMETKRNEYFQRAMAREGITANSAKEYADALSGAGALKYEAVQRRVQAGRAGLGELQQAHERNQRGARLYLKELERANKQGTIEYAEALAAVEQADAEFGSEVAQTLERDMDLRLRALRASGTGGGLAQQANELRMLAADRRLTPQQQKEYNLRADELAKQYADTQRAGIEQRNIAGFNARGDNLGAANERILQIQAAIQRAKRAGDTEQIPALEAELIDAQKAARDAGLAVFSAELDFYVALGGGDAIEAADAAIAKAQEALRYLDPDSAEAWQANQTIVEQTRIKAQAMANRENLRRSLAATQSGDPLSAAQAELAAADDAVRLAVGIDAQLEAQRRRVEAQRSVANTISEIGQAQIGLLMAFAEAAGDVNRVAQLQLDAAVKALADYQAANPGSNEANDPEISRLKGAIVSAEANKKQVARNDRLSIIDFQLATEQRTVQSAIAEMQAILDTMDAGTAEYRDLYMKIYDLKKQASGDMAFNLPTDIRLPTLYEARRLNTAGGSANYDQRNVNVTMYVNNGMDEQRAGQFLADSLGSRRLGTVPRSY